MSVSYRGGKPVSRPSPRRSIPKGGISYRGGKRITPVSPIAGVSTAKYRAVVPFMQASYVTAGMPGMTAKSIAMFTKAATMPSQLTHSERAFVRQHMPSMRPEYRKKFVEFERELTQAELKKRLIEEKKGIEHPDIRRQVASFLPGVTPALLWGVTPETKQFAAKTWKRISEGVTPVSIAKMGIAISPIGITIAPLMAMSKKIFPGVQKELVAIPSRAVERVQWIAATPSERAMMAMMPSMEAETKIFKGETEAYEARWAPHVRDEYFRGTEVQYRQQVREYETLQREQAQLEKQYGVFTGLEAKIPKEKEVRFWGVPAAYEREQERASKWVKARTPEMGEALTYAETPEMKREIERTQSVYRRLFGLPSTPFKWEKEAARIESEYKIGMYGGLREKPFEMVATTAIFAALPPVIKGLKYVGKAARIAPAMKTVTPWVPAMAKIGKVPYPTLKRAEEAIRVGVPKGILPPVMRHIPTIAGLGMGAAFVGAMGYELYEAERGMRARKLGEIITTEMLPMIAGTYIGYKYAPKVAGLIYTAGKKKIPLSEIGVEKGYPLRRDISPKALEESFMRSTLVEPPEVFHAAARMVVPKEPIPKRAVLPGEVPGGFYAWEAVPFIKSKVRIVEPGTSELPGEYYAPILEAYFAKVSPGISPKFSLFGITAPDVSFPSALRMRAGGLREIPAHIRAKGRKTMVEFMETEAEKGVFYMPLMKAEYEAVLPVGTQVQRVGYRYYTKVEGVRVPIHEAEAVWGEALGKATMSIEHVRMKYGAEYYEKAVPLITPARLGYKEVSRVVSEAFYKPYRYKEPYYPKLPSVAALYPYKYESKIYIPKEYRITDYRYREHEYRYVPRKYKFPVYEYGIPTYKPRKYKLPKYDYRLPKYDYKIPKIPEYDYKIPEYGYRILGYKIPKYKIPKYEYKVPPPPDITFEMPWVEKKPRRRRKKYKFEEIPWKEKHYIPTLRELMRSVPGMKVSKPTVFEPKMPKLPKGIM